jgi:hypothetical protein
MHLQPQPRVSDFVPRISGRNRLKRIDSVLQTSSLFKAMAAPSKINLARAILDRFGHSKSNTYAALSGLSGVLKTTLWYRDYGRPSIQQRGAEQQYLTPQEEKALVNYVLRMSKNGCYRLRDLV